MQNAVYANQAARRGTASKIVMLRKKSITFAVLLAVAVVPSLALQKPDWWDTGTLTEIEAKRHSYEYSIVNSTCRLVGVSPRKLRVREGQEVQYSVSDGDMFIIDHDGKTQRLRFVLQQLLPPTMVFPEVAPRFESVPPPDIKVPPQRLPKLFADGIQEEIVEGTVIAYDWSTRYYMEGARVERFIFRADGASSPLFMRVVLLWHPADQPRILPEDFYAPEKQWRLTLRTSSPFDFVRQYCTGDTATFSAQVDGRKIELPRYVKPTTLPPDADRSVSFRTAIAEHPTSPEMPDLRSLPCLYLEKVTAGTKPGE